MADISREEFPRHIESNGGRLPQTGSFKFWACRI